MTNLMAFLCCEQNRTVRAGASFYDPSMAELVVTAQPEPMGGRDRAAADKPDPGKQTEPGEPLWRHVLGEHLRSLRHDRGQTLGDIATRAGVSPQYLSEMERGLKEPSSEMIAAVAGALEVTLGDLTLDIAERLTATARVGSAMVSAGQSALALAA